MPTWLLSALPYVWKFLKHWGVYILITLILVGGPWLIYRSGYNKGYKARVCPPTYTVGAGGVVNNHYKEDDFKWLGVKAKCLWLNLRLGY
jgi:hypothetical protein